MELQDSTNNLQDSNTIEENLLENTQVISESETIDLDNHKKEENKYTLNGYLNQHIEKGISIASHVKTVKKRWFVYSGLTCKLYYYRSKNEPEPLGEIDIALATFSYNLESENQGEFTIRCGGKDFLLEASSSKERLYWLRNLQKERREFNERLNFNKYKSSETSIGRLDSGLLKDPDPMPPLAPDPHSDLMSLINKSLESSSNQTCNSTTKNSKANLNLPLNIFRTSSTPLPKKDQLVPSTNNNCSSETTSPVTHHSDSNNLDRIGRRFRSSFKIKRSSFIKSNSEDVTEAEKDKCKNCLQLKEALGNAIEQSINNKDNGEAFKEAVYLLQREVESLQKENSTLEKLSNTAMDDKDIVTILREKDQRIVELENIKHKLSNSLSSMTASLRDSRMHSEHLEDKVSMLTSLVEAKNSAIVNLSRQLEAFLNDGSLGTSVGSNSTFYSISPLMQNYETKDIGTQTCSDIDDLKDMLEGYKCQNTFLNKEILELNLVQKQRNDRERKLISESSNWEAKFYQIQSKYLLLLNDLHSPQANQHDSKVLSQLLQDVVHSHGVTDLRVVEKQGKSYDEFGFCMSAPRESDILSKAEFLQKQSTTYANQAGHNRATAPTGTPSWESLLVGTNVKELPHHPELKDLVRDGIPYQYKGKVWRLLIDSHIGKYKASLPPTYYEDLLAKRNSIASTLDPSVKQIELDLLRTLPNNRHYESPFADGIPKLRRVLLAYSRHNLAVGYCQGLNRLAAIALLFLNEDYAFWCLVCIIEYLMPPDFYTRNLLGSQVDQRVLKDLVSEKLPKLSQHFDHHGLDISLFTFNWFLCIYIDVIPPSTYLYIWDSFLYEGTKVLFRFSLAIFKLCEESILEKKDYMAIFDYLRSVPEPVTDVKKLKEVAFQWANPLSKRYIRNRRDYHRAIVKAELDEVEEVRKSYRVNKETPRRHASSPLQDEDSDEEKGGGGRPLTPPRSEQLKEGVKDMVLKMGEIKDRGKKMVKNRFGEDPKNDVTHSVDVKWIKVFKNKDEEDDVTDEEIDFEDVVELNNENAT